MPPGAIGQALRGIAYFGGARILWPIVVVLAWAALAVALNLVADRRDRAGGRAAVEAGASVAPSIAAAR